MLADFSGPKAIKRTAAFWRPLILSAMFLPRYELFPVFVQPVTQQGRNWSLQVRPFEFVRKTDASQVLNFIQDEHPQTIAMILSYLSPNQASMIIGSLGNCKVTVFHITQHSLNRTVVQQQDVFEYEHLLATRRLARSVHSRLLQS